MDSKEAAERALEEEDFGKLCQLCHEYLDGARPKAYDRERAPADLYHLLKPHTLGGFPDWIRMALIWASVVRVAGGMPSVDLKDPRGWRQEDRDQSTPLLLAHNFAVLIDMPDGPVIRVEVPNDTP